MRTKVRKLTSVFLAVVLAFSILTVAPFTVNAVTSSNWSWPTSVHSIKSDWPNYSSGSYHAGTDFPVALNSPVYSTCDGEVVAVTSLTTSYGKHIKIKAVVNGAVVYMRYCHLNSFVVSVGDKVKSGQLIAYSGSTGNSTGPHLHYEVRNAQDRYGNSSSPNLNPRNYLPGTSFSFETYAPNSHWYDNYNIVDLGMEFYATIAKNTSSKAVGLDSNNNIVVRPYEVFNDQIWHFIRQSDGGYKIINALTDSYIVGDTVASLEYEAGNNNKIWYITKDSNGYSLIHLSGGIVNYLHPSWGLWNDNNSISLNDSVDYVDINFIEGNDNLPSNINISIDKTIYYKGDTLNLTWSKSKYAFDYKIDIWKDNGEHILDTITRNNTYSLSNLETGYYGIYIYASNIIGKSQFADIHFYVLQDLGDEDFYSVICNDNELALDIDSNNNIIVSEYTVYNNQIWEFQRQVSGCYKIRNVKFDKFISMDKENIILTNDAEQSTEWYIGSKNEKNTIYTSINGYTYYLQSSENQNDEHTVCVSQKLSTQNLNRIYGNDNSPASFDIYIPNGYFSKNDDIILKWDKSKYAFSYIVEIINENGLIERIETVENNLNIKNLVDGEYLLSIKAVNNIGTFSKDNLKFFIKSNEHTDTLKYKVISVNKIGDANGDGEVYVLDVSTIQLYVAKMTAPEIVTEACDVDGDGDINVNDVSLLQMKIAKLI